MAIYGHIWVDAQTRNRNETKFFNILLKKNRNYLLKKTKYGRNFGVRHGNGNGASLPIQIADGPHKTRPVCFLQLEMTCLFCLYPTQCLC